MEFQVLVEAVPEVSPLPAAGIRLRRIQLPMDRLRVVGPERQRCRLDPGRVGRALRDRLLSLRPLRFLLGARALPRLLRARDQRHDQPCREGDHGDGRGGDQRPVPPHEAKELIGQCRRSRQDRLVGKIAADVLRQRSGGCVALSGVRLEGLGEDQRHVAAEAAVHTLERGGRLLAENPQRLGQRELRQLSREPAAHQLESDDPQRVDVRPRVDVGQPARLLRAHVVQGADHLAGRRHTEAARFVRPEHARDAEVQHLRPSTLLDEDVAGLQVAVDDAVLVRVLHGVADVREQLETRPHVERSGVLQERPAVDELHGEVREGPQRAGESARGVDLGDRGVPQTREQLRLQLEALQRLRRGDLSPEDLQGDMAPGLVLLGQEDRAHAARAQPAHDAVRSDALGLLGLRKEVLLHLAGHGGAQLTFEG